MGKGVRREGRRRWGIDERMMGERRESMRECGTMREGRVESDGRRRKVSEGGSSWYQAEQEIFPLFWLQIKMGT